MIPDCFSQFASTRLDKCFGGPFLSSFPHPQHREREAVLSCEDDSRLFRPIRLDSTRQMIRGTFLSLLRYDQDVESGKRCYDIKMFPNCFSQFVSTRLDKWFGGTFSSLLRYPLLDLFWYKPLGTSTKSDCWICCNHFKFIRPILPKWKTSRPIVKYDLGKLLRPL